MVDVLTKKQRSYTMSQVKSKWTKIEVVVHDGLKRLNVPHKMHPDMVGSPDLILLNKKVAIFLDGCFWHGCNKDYKEPKTNVIFWRNKIKNNIKRDIKNKRLLRKMGWTVVSIWEHQINSNPKTVLNRIKRMNF